MAIDLALGTGGQPNSRSRRSDAAPIDTGQVTERSRDVPRQVTQRDGGADGLSSISDALGSFFPVIEAAAKHDTEQEIIEIKRANAEEIARLENEVRSNPKGAREALKTGRFDDFIPDSEMRRRRAIQDGFKSMVGQQMAYDDFHGELREIIEATPLDGNPDDAVAEYVKKNTEGADPMFARDYGRTIEKLSSKSVSEFREARLDLQMVEAERGVTELLKDKLRKRSFPPTLEGGTATQRELLSAIPSNAPDAYMRMTAIWDRTIIDMAAEGNPTALKMAQVKDPARDGTSVFDRNPGEMSAAVNTLVTARARVKSLAASDDLEAIEERLARVVAGVAGDDTLADLWTDTQLHRQRFGDSSAYDTMRDKIGAALGSQTTNTAAISRIARGGSPSISDSAWSKDLAPLFWSGAVIPMFMAEGLSQEGAETRRNEYLANRGSGKTMVDANSAILTGTGPADEMEAVFNTLATLDLASDRPMEGNHLKGTAVILYHGMLSVQKGGGDHLAYRKLFMESINAGGDPENHYARQEISPGDKDGKLIGRGGLAKAAKDMWGGFTQEDLALEGLVYGTNMPDYDDLAPSARAVVERAVNQASFALATQNADGEQIRALAATMVKGSLSLSRGPDGKMFVTQAHNPPMGLSAEGKPVRGAKVTEEVLDRAGAVLEGPEAAEVVQALQLSGAAVADVHTAAGEGLSVHTGQGGHSRPLYLLPGQTMMVPRGDLPEDFKNNFFQHRAEDELTRTLQVPAVPEPGKERIAINDSLFMLYVKDVGAWTLRYRDVEPGKPTPLNLSDVTKANRDSRVGEEFDRQALRSALRGRHGPDAELMTPPKPDPNFMSPEAPLGSPIPHDDDAGPVTEDEGDEFVKTVREVLDNLVNRGIIAPDAALEAHGGTVDTLLNSTTRALLAERTRGGWLDDLTKPANQRHRKVVAEYLEEWEGRVPYVYDDDKGGQWGPKSKGNPTVGIGFNMNRPDARKLIAEVGADYDKLMDGSQQLTDAQTDNLLALSIRETGVWLRNHFEGEDLTNNQWLSMLSLAMNSRWDENGPTLIGKGLTAAVRAKDWDAADNEIRNRSQGNVKPHHLKGVRARRADEANMFRGALPRK